jgi:hypothetical protein
MTFGLDLVLSCGRRPCSSHGWTDNRLRTGRATFVLRRRSSAADRPITALGGGFRDSFRTVAFAAEIDNVK